jgi:trk system potassium uptake protein TrkA
MAMQRFAVIGLGHFGAHVARTLYESGKEVLALDADPEAVERMAEHATRAAVVDATDRGALEAIGVGDADAAIISLGDRMDLSTLTALHVREMGVGFIAVKALSEEHGRILKALGVHDVIQPEKDMAIRLANRLARTDVVEFLPLLPGYAITEMKAPEDFVGKTLQELALRNTLNVQLVAIHRASGEMNIVPRAQDRIQRGDLLVLLGENRDLDRVREIVRRQPRA